MEHVQEKRRSYPATSLETRKNKADRGNKGKILKIRVSGAQPYLTLEPIEIDSLIFSTTLTKFPQNIQKQFISNYGNYSFP